jgi:YesN/AraC family two-component response regulator
MPFNILLVDDDRDFREEFRECLDEYGVVEASSGQEALEILGRPNEIDLVILDVVMPGMRGTDVLRAMKRMRPDLGVVILTGYGTKSTAIEALKGRADDFIEKPFDPVKTKELIARLLRDKATRGDGAAGGADAKIRRVMYFVERNYDKNVSLRDAAAIASLSPKYLSRVFKRSAGIGFNEYKAKVKARKAADLLAGSDYNVDEISAKLGYANPESFARAFKNLMGLAPSLYRTREKRGVSARCGRRPARKIRQSKRRGRR